MFDIKSLNFEVDTAGMSMNEVATLYDQFFNKKDFNWWYEVLPGDTVLDIGCGIGLYSAQSLDRGAKRVFMIEPNKRFLATAIKNVSPHLFNKDPGEWPIVPINAAMGRTDIDRTHVYKSATLIEDEEEPKLMSLPELIEYYDLQSVDVIKCDVGPALYNILHKDHKDYLMTQTRFIAARVHLSTQYGANEKFIEWKDRFLKACFDTNRLFFQDETLGQKLFRQDWYKHVPLSFMVYIKNY